MACSSASVRAARKGQGDHRVEMRAGQRAEDNDQHGQHAAGGKAVGEQTDRDIPIREALAHDAGADHRREQQARAETFCDESTHHQSSTFTTALRFLLVARNRRQ